MCSSYNLIFGEDALISKCLVEGSRADRNDDGTIFVKTLEHAAGVIMIYQNNSHDDVL